MGKVTILLVIVFIVVVLGIVGGGFLLAYWQIPVTTTQVEKVLPDARFPK